MSNKKQFKMNKLISYDLEIQGKDISHTNTIHCLIPYKSKGIVTKEQIDGYEQVVKQVLRYVIQRIGKKGIFHEFTVGKLHITSTINDLKTSTKQHKSLNSFTIDKDNTRITIENDGTWCFMPVLTKAIKSYFEDYITFLQNVLTMQTNGIVIHNSNIRRKTSEYEDALLNVCIKGEELIDNVCKAEINLIQWKMGQNMNCTKFVQFFCKLIKKNYTIFCSLLILNYMYDIIIIGGGASGLFCSINAPKDSKKLIIEKQNSLGNKILLSGGGRCNFTNLNIDPDKYFGQNKKMLSSVFHKYSNYDFMNYLDENGIEYNVEDNSRVILKSGKAKELLDFLIKKSKENNTEIQTGQTITRVEKENDFFKITTEQAEFLCKKLVISTGGISYPQIGATSFGIDIAKQFGLKIVPNFPALCGLETKEDFSSLSGSSITGNVELFDGNKKIYENQGNILFTHRGLSGPAIFNCSAGLAEYLTKSYLSPFLKGEARRAEGFLKSSTTSWSPSFKKEDINLKITPHQITKKLEKFMDNMSSGVLTKDIKIDSSLRSEGQPKIITKIINFRPLEEAKVSSGGVNMNEIKPNFECKNVPNLYFIGETLDIIGETGGFNLQRARSSGAICGQGF